MSQEEILAQVHLNLHQLGILLLTDIAVDGMAQIKQLNTSWTDNNFHETKNVLLLAGMIHSPILYVNRSQDLRIWNYFKCVPNAISWLLLL